MASNKAKRLELELPDPARDIPKTGSARGPIMELGGRSYTVSSLSLAQYIANEGKLKKLDATSGNFFETAIELVLMAMQRNYPSLERADVEEFMDLNNLPELLGVITGTNRNASAPVVPKLEA